MQNLFKSTKSLSYLNKIFMRSIYTEQRETTLVNTHTNEDKTLISFLSFHAHNHSSHLSSASLKENPKLTKNTDLKNPHLPNLFTKLVHHTAPPPSDELPMTSIRQRAGKKRVREMRRSSAAADGGGSGEGGGGVILFRRKSPRIDFVFPMLKTTSDDIDDGGGPTAARPPEPRRLRQLSWCCPV
ncbi:hypothetical protein HanRHA438_Chr15g0718271 [Helianthus annuus]|nr:hypothetical protein HanRHA438_Chr15g0718271 [Helianthus annuus]